MSATRSSNSSSVRVVLSRPDRLGDVLITSSLLPVLRSLQPGLSLYWMISSKFHGLFQNHSCLAGLLSKDGGSRGLSSVRADAIVHLQPDPVIENQAELAGISQRIGYRKDWWTKSLTTALIDDRPLGLKHEAEYSFALVAQLKGLFDSGLPASAPLKPSIHLSKSGQASLFAKLPASLDLSEYVAINPTAYSESLRWPWQNFLKVSRWLSQEFGLKTLLISGEPADPSLLALAQALSTEGPAPLNLAGQLELDELAWLLNVVRLHLARNTGTSHLAAAVDCPQVELFIRYRGRYSINRWKALSSRSIVVCPDLDPHLLETNPAFWSRCARSISVDAVCDGIRQALAFPYGGKSSPLSSLCSPLFFPETGAESLPGGTGP